MTQYSVDAFKQDVLNFYDETFTAVQGIYLDRGTSLFETLEGISAETASIPVGAKCASIAAQVDHVRFYIDVLEGYLTGNPPEKVDWKEIWNRVEAVTPEEWDAIQARLRASYERVRGVISAVNDWNESLGDAMAIVVHTAYHLGEIRQALCMVK